MPLFTYIFQVWIEFGKVHNRKCVDFFRNLETDLFLNTMLVTASQDMHAKYNASHCKPRYARKIQC